ncbi:capsular polysaccharide biosynthesis protein [Sansalvadorimonas sp. 2012CJ34-2]|uniref:Capsular polysaccharide biosynthesis protein n=1 Tax=Parendozoicomonas callyspongiae TaxID=2942213 RepID=A0ABT0PHG1_9GAMM|nr:capsular polysaccharide biosynthesis protein [Sansalvadorimonas sp. 2012CJ34-2]MCL6270773.1 capsular polysaccharide biosynthesis protein [Sansalvadorimonas sp. 2012CJ34-2]
MFYTSSSGISSAPELSTLLGGDVHRLSWFRKKSLQQGTVIGWGMKENTRKVRELACNAGLPFWHLEDGFISYLGHPSLGDRRFSLIVDKAGIYYDGTRPSDLENLLNNKLWLNWDLLQRSRNLLDTICRHQISKYNHEPVGSYKLPVSDKPRVLVVDQTFGDCSIQYGMANESSFQAMLDAALTENPDAEVWVKVHPDVVLGKKKGYLGNNLPNDNPRIHVLADKVNAQSLFPWFSKVYVVTSQLGFEALWHRKDVVCFGLPFYSGWGLTDDRVPCPRRKQKHTIESLFAAACLHYTRYIHPETGQRCELEGVLDLIVLQRRYQQPQVNTLYAIGFSLWKRAFVSRFAQGLGRDIQFVSSKRALRKRIQPGDGVLVWGMKGFNARSLVSSNGLSESESNKLTVWRMEDGFIRSCGLGAELRRPGSLVIDQQGIYYDATRPSVLEQALNTLQLSDQEKERGQKLQSLLLSRRISKYNLAGQPQDVFAGAKPNQRKVLITGQVDSDASLKYGSPETFSNIDLLKKVSSYLKGQNVYIVYKPHPDVVQAGRAGHIAESEALQFVNRVVTGVDIFDCLEQCDELHVMSSQAGFEALLQNKAVHCWGMPFYAGWGLTTDHLSCERRTACRTLEELVYIALCHYPRYINWNTCRFTSPENQILQLSRERQEKQAARKAGKEDSPFTKWLSRKKRKATFLMEALAQ